MTGDPDFPCRICNDPAPRGWHYCIKCNLWTAHSEQWRDDPNYYALLHPALGWLDRQRMRMRESPDSMEALVRKLAARVAELEHEMERGAIQVMNDRLQWIESDAADRRRREPAKERKTKEPRGEQDAK